MTTLDLEPLLRRLAELVALELKANGNGDGHQPPETPDKLLTADEAAKRLGVKPRWLYGRELPFTVRLPNSRAVRFSARGLARYLERRQAR